MDIMARGLGLVSWRLAWALSGGCGSKGVMKIGDGISRRFPCTKPVAISPMAVPHISMNRQLHN